VYRIISVFWWGLSSPGPGAGVESEDKTAKRLVLFVGPAGGVSTKPFAAGLYFALGAGASIVPGAGYAGRGFDPGGAGVSGLHAATDSSGERSEAGTSRGRRPVTPSTHGAWGFAIGHGEFPFAGAPALPWPILFAAPALATPPDPLGAVCWPAQSGTPSLRRTRRGERPAFRHGPSEGAGDTRPRVLVSVCCIEAAGAGRRIRSPPRHDWAERSADEHWRAGPIDLGTVRTGCWGFPLRPTTKAEPGGGRGSVDPSANKSGIGELIERPLSASSARAAGWNGALRWVETGGPSERDLFSRE